MSTRLYQSGWEQNTTAEWTSEIGAGTTLPTISSTLAYTGTYSMQNQTAAGLRSIGTAFSGVTKISAHVHLNHNGGSSASASYRSTIFRWTDTTGTYNLIAFNPTTNNIEIIINDIVVTTISAATAGIDTVATWYALGLVVFANATTGYVNFYVNGVSKLSATSQNTGTSISALYIGGSYRQGTPTGSGIGWNNYAYFDDPYVDDTTGEADVAPTPRRFLWSIVDGNGGASQWTGSDGDSTNNYLLVDDVTPDSDTTYVYAQAISKQDLYATAAITVPAGYTIAAAIPTVLAKRSSTTEQLQLQAYDGVSTTTGSAQNPSTAYGPLWERMTTQPDTTDWNETDFNAMQFGQLSAGTF